MAEEKGQEEEMMRKTMVSLEEHPHLNLTDESATEGEAIGRRETKALHSVKLLVIAFLVIAAVVVAVAVYVFLSKSEEREFEHNFDIFADKVLGAIGKSLDQTLGAVDSYLLDIVSSNRHAGGSWPFVTVPNFSVRSAKLLSLSNAVMLSMHPLVTGKERSLWENYTAHQNHWVQESIEIQNEDDFYHVPTVESYYTKDVIHTIEDLASTDPASSQGTKSPGPYLPTWQVSPVGARFPPYNMDLFQTTANDYVLQALQAKRVIITKPYMLPDPNDPLDVMQAEVVATWMKEVLEEGTEPLEPISSIYVPIVDQVGAVTPSPQVGKAVGIMNLSVYWRDLLKDILPSGSRGVIVVFENECGPVPFTYQIDGPRTTYLGRGDLHEKNFDHLELACRLANVHGYSVGGRKYTGLPLDEQTCPFNLRVYPSTDMRNDYNSKDPVIFTLLAVLIFVFTTGVFGMYDCCVERRQKVVMSTVRERTRTLEDTNRRLEEANRKVVQASALQLEHFACMSHEIRTPLNCIVGLSSLLEESDDLKPLQRDSMGMIVASCDLLRAVVDDVLDYSKLETGNIKVELKRSDLQQTLSSVVHSVEMRGLVTNVSLRTRYDPLIPAFIETDAQRIQQILYNLLGNAVKFSKNGGIVELQVSISRPGFNDEAYSPKPEDGKGAVKAGKVLRFVVKDYGKGIETSEFPKIFKPFIQSGEKADSENIYGGTGLGLPISVKLIHGFGGAIAVESEKGRWTKFTVDVPFCEEEVDPFCVASGLKGIPVLLIGNETETIQQVGENLRFYNVRLDVYASMKDVAKRLTSSEDYLVPDPSVISLVQEDLFDKTTVELLKKRGRSVVITFGTGFTVDGVDGHHRSLTKMLPSALVSSLLASLESVEKKSVPVLARQASRSFYSSAPYQSLRCLIAEDNVVNQKVIRRILERLGVPDVEIVDNGQKAVDREAEKEFDVVLMDMQMPVMDGIVACRLINERRGGHPKAKIVFVSAHVQENFKEECRKAGADGYIAKPCTIQRVDECLRAFVGRKSNSVSST